MQEVEEQLIAEAEARHEGTQVQEEAPVVEAPKSEGEIPVINLDAPAPSNDTETEVEATEEAPASEEVVTDTNDTQNLHLVKKTFFLSKNKYGRDVSSLDEFTAEPESSGDSRELPEDVAAYNATAKKRQRNGRLHEIKS